MSRPYEFVPQDVLEANVVEFTETLTRGALRGYSSIQGNVRRELRKVNRELRFRQRWETEPRYPSIQRMAGKK